MKSALLTFCLVVIGAAQALALSATAPSAVESLALNELNKQGSATREAVFKAIESNCDAQYCMDSYGNRDVDELRKTYVFKAANLTSSFVGTYEGDACPKSECTPAIEGTATSIVVVRITTGWKWDGGTSGVLLTVQTGYTRADDKAKPIANKLFKVTALPEVIGTQQDTNVH